VSPSTNFTHQRDAFEYRTLQRFPCHSRQTRYRSYIRDSCATLPSSRCFPTMISPFGNATVLPEAMWHSEPTHRGTFSILSSCLITMVLCIWTAVHLNLPEHRKESQQVYRKILWLVLGLFAPEVVVWNARGQRKKMKWLSSDMRRKGYMAEETKAWEGVRDWCNRTLARIQVFFLLRAKDWPELAESRKRQNLCHNRVHPWTDVHSWYIVMGGLAFEDIAVEELQFMPGDRSRMTLTRESVYWMAEHRPHLLPDVSRKHIEDKSKSGGMGKFLTCWQATYFCAQCVFRLSRQYSISLLDLVGQASRRSRAHTYHGQ
jgi:hypothetical protein